MSLKSLLGQNLGRGNAGLVAGGSLQGTESSLGSLGDILVVSLGVDTEKTGIRVSKVEGRELGTASNLASSGRQGGGTSGGPLDETVTTQQGAENLGSVELGGTGSSALEGNGNVTGIGGGTDTDLTSVVLGGLNLGCRASSNVAESRVGQGLELSLGDTGGDEGDLVGNKVVGSVGLQVLGGDIGVRGGVDRVAETVAESSRVKSLNNSNLGRSIGSGALSSNLVGNSVELVISELGLGNEIAKDLNEVWAIDPT